MKKSFFDGWDNLIHLVLMNVGFVLCLAAVFFLPGAGEGLGDASLVLTIPGILLIHLFAGAVSVPLMEAADFKAFDFRRLPEGLKKTWQAALFLGGINSVMSLIVAVAFPFYLSFGNFLGIIGAGFIFWIGLFWLLSFQYFFPIYTRLNGGFIQTLKKCMLIALDNPGFSFFTLIYSLIMLIISVVTAFILPGITGIMLFVQDAVKLRLYKYDWIEENGVEEKKKIPWDALFSEDQERIGPRSLKGMIFPWKD